MNEKIKQANIAKLIEDLSNENAKLKEENETLKLAMDLSEKHYNESTDRAESLIAECDQRIAEYNEVIAGARQAKQEYEAAIKELSILKKQYEIKMKDLFKQL